MFQNLHFRVSFCFPPIYIISIIVNFNLLCDAIVCQVSLWYLRRKKINPYPNLWDKSNSCGTTQFDEKRPLCHVHTIHVCLITQHICVSTTKVCMVKPKSLFRTALRGPFGKGFVPHSHRRRLSLTKFCLLTIPYHKFTMGLYTPYFYLSICNF